MKKFHSVLAVVLIFTSLSFSQNFATKGTVDLGGSFFPSKSDINHLESVVFFNNFALVLIN